jgi:hypothetical protein
LRVGSALDRSFSSIASAMLALTNNNTHESATQPPKAVIREAAAGAVKEAMGRDAEEALKASRRAGWRAAVWGPPGAARSAPFRLCWLACAPHTKRTAAMESQLRSCKRRNAGRRCPVHASRQGTSKQRKTPKTARPPPATPRRPPTKA